MSLVVVVSNAAVPEPLTEQLEQLGYETLHADSVKLATELCANRQALLVIATDVAGAKMLASEERRVPIVAFIDSAKNRLNREQVIDLWRSGVADLWEWPADRQEIASRVTLLNHRRESVALEAEQTLADHLVEVQRDQRAGRYIQLGMLPPNPMAIADYRFTHRIAPSLILSGDFVDYFSITDQHFLFYVADVSGHGASSAFVTVLLKNFSRRIRREYRRSMLTDPGEVLAWLNSELIEQQIDKHVALFFAIGDTRSHELRFVNAGHFPPAILVGKDRSEVLEQPGKPVGLFDAVSYDCGTVKMNVGDRLVVFTDGVLEVIDGAGLAGKEANLFAAAQTHSTLDELWTGIGLHGQPCPDDVTCLLVTREA